MKDFGKPRTLYNQRFLLFILSFIKTTVEYRRIIIFTNWEATVRAIDQPQSFSLSIFPANIRSISSSRVILVMFLNKYLRIKIQDSVK